jgi:DedD protein
MGLFSSIFQRKSGGAARTPPAETSADAVQEARTRARRRLIGAVVLVVIGVIGFPLLFETQPRPIPVDIPIDIPRKETAPPLATPVAKPPRPVAAAPAADTPASSSGPIVTETVAEAGREVPPPAARSASAAAKPASAPKPATVAAVKPAASAATARPAASAAAESRRAKALLEGEGADKDPAGAGRFVVQVGAFSDAAAARDTRQKIEKLGLKTYTQVAETASGSRIRVRVGPFASRDEAERAQARIKAAGASAVVLTL